MTIDRNQLKMDTDIAQWLEQNKAFEEHMDRAIRLVASDDRTMDFDQAKVACIKAFDAIVDGIKVFFSFVGNDSPFAFAFLDSLNNADTSNRLCRKPPFPYMFHRSESRAIGDVYQQQILAALRRAHWMFVVVPSDEAVSSFVDFEIGAFSASKTLVDRLICVHHPAIAQMDVTKDYDQVKTTRADLFRMFERLFSNADAMPGVPPLCKREHLVRSGLVDSLISESATLRPRLARAVMLQFRIHLRDDGTGKDITPDSYLQEDASRYAHSRDDELKKGTAPLMPAFVTEDLNSKLVSGTDEFAEIFGWTDLPQTFGELTSKLEQKYPAVVHPWKSNLAKQIADIEQGTPPSGNYLSFQDFRGRRRFRSSLISFTNREDPREVLSILIGLQEAILYPSTRAPVLLEILETTMRLTYRFRWEVLEAFQGRIDVGDIELIENRLAAAEQELMYRGVAGGERIFELFEDNARKEVMNMQQKWLKYRAADQTSGVLDVIFAEKNQAAATRLEDAIPVMKEMNREFMLLAAPRFAELVREVWG